MTAACSTFGWEMSVSSGLGGDEGGHSNTALCTLVTFMVRSMSSDGQHKTSLFDIKQHAQNSKCVIWIEMCSWRLSKINNEFNQHKSFRKGN